MTRILLGLLLVAATVAVGYSELGSDKHDKGQADAPRGDAPEMTASELEKFYFAPGQPMHCRDGSGGWHYVCRFTDQRGKDLHFGVAVDERGPVARSAVTGVNARVPRADRTSIAIRARFRESIDLICDRMRVKREKLGAPSDAADIETFLSKYRSISGWYLRKLSTLTPPDPEDRPLYKELLRLMSADIADAGAMLRAIRAQDGRSVAELKVQLDSRAARQAEIHTQLSLCIVGRRA